MSEDTKMPDCLKEFLSKLTPSQADDLWIYFDGCTNEGIIEILIEIALRDPAIAQRQASMEKKCRD